MKQLPKISIIIVNYNAAKVMNNCLASLFQQQQVDFEVIVVDNASQDDSLVLLRTYKDKITLIESDQNLGFGKANNLAFKQARGDFILLLNPDAALQKNTDLLLLQQFLQENSNYGIVGPKVLKNKTTTLPRYSYPGEKYSGVNFANLPGKIAWIIGACMLIRRECYQQLNGFDEDYFLYAEETDLCLRARKLGYSIGYVDNVTVDHIGGFSENKTIPLEVWHRKQHAIYLFYQKHYQKHELKKIAQKEYLLGLCKMISLKLRIIFCLNKHKGKLKLARQKIICQTAKKFF